MEVWLQFDHPFPYATLPASRIIISVQAELSGYQLSQTLWPRRSCVVRLPGMHLIVRSGRLGKTGFELPSRKRSGGSDRFLGYNAVGVGQPTTLGLCPRNRLLLHARPGRGER